jgi:hypothetical protein
MIAAADGAAITSGTVTVYVTGDAGTQAAGSVGSGACTHEGNGFYTYAPAQAETNYSHVAFTFTHASAIPVTVQVYPNQIVYTTAGQVDATMISTAANAITATSINADALTAAKVADDVGEQFADQLLNRNLSTGTDSGSATVRTVRQALRFLRNKWSISGTTLTVTKEDDSTASWTSELTTSGAADPVTGSDPASS